MAKFVLLDEVEKKIEKDKYLIMRGWWYYGLIDDDIYKAVESCKQYEFEPPKKAKWLETRDDNKKRCSNCDFIFMIATYPACSADFCPHCGARMDEEQ